MTVSLDLAVSNLVSPAILCFVLGAVASFVRSDLKLPDQVFTGLSIFLMLSIGFQGGAKMADRSMAELALPLGAALLLASMIPIWCYGLLRLVLGLKVADAAAISAHYGSVSAVTFAAVIQFLSQQQIAFEGYAAALLAVMEVPAIVIAIGIAGVASVRARAVEVSAGRATLLGASPATSHRQDLSPVLVQVLSSKSVLLLVGGMAIGATVGMGGLSVVKPFFFDLFPGVLCLFMLDLGRVAASHASEFRKVGVGLGVFALAAPVVHAVLGIVVSYAIGLSLGGAVVLGTLAASASYIVAPAAVRIALPDANPGLYLTCALAITFPFNLLFGIPIYLWIAQAVYGQ